MKTPKAIKKWRRTLGDGSPAFHWMQSPSPMTLCAPGHDALRPVRIDLRRPRVSRSCICSSFNLFALDQTDSAPVGVQYVDTFLPIDIIGNDEIREHSRANGYVSIPRDRIIAAIAEWCASNPNL